MPVVAAHTMATPELSRLDAIRLIASIGFDGVELIVDDEYPCALPFAASAADLREVRAVADGCGVRVVALTPYSELFSAADAARRGAAIDQLRRCIDMAAVLGSISIRFLAGVVEGRAVAGTASGGGSSPPQEHDAARGRVVAAMRELATLAQPIGCSLNLETHPRSYAETVADTEWFVSAVDHPAAGVLYDPANILILDPAGWADERHRLLPHTRHVHVKDFRVFGGTVTPTPVLMGEGDLEFGGILRELRAAGFDGILSAEYVKRWHPRFLPDANIALRHELKAIRSLWDAAGSGGGA